MGERKTARGYCQGEVCAPVGVCHRMFPLLVLLIQVVCRSSVWRGTGGGGVGGPDGVRTRNKQASNQAGCRRIACVRAVCLFLVYISLDFFVFGYFVCFSFAKRCLYIFYIYLSEGSSKVPFSSNTCNLVLSSIHNDERVVCTPAGTPVYRQANR